MLRVLHRILVIINILFAVTLLLSYLSVYINPEKFWLLALAGLSYPFLLIFNLLFVIYWIIRWKRAFFISFIAIIIGVGHLSNFIQLPFGNKAKTEKADFIALSYNVNLFRLYTWSTKKPSYSEITEFIKSSHSDIVCLQEFFVVDGQFSEKMAKNLLDMNSHIKYLMKRGNTEYGIATFSKYPIIQRGEIKFENTSNACIYSDIKIGDDTIRVYNNHLQSLRLKQRNLNFLLGQNIKDEDSNVELIRDISLKLRDAFKKRAQQVNLISEHIKRSPYPVIVCGDFNDSPMSYTYRKMTKNLHDSFKEAGEGIANTYVRILPTFRIDYILHSKGLKTLQFTSPRVDYSDHYPVISSFKFSK